MEHVTCEYDLIEFERLASSRYVRIYLELSVSFIIFHAQRLADDCVNTVRCEYSKTGYT